MGEDKSIEQEVARRMVDAVGLDMQADDIRTESSLRDDLGLDSLQSVTLVLELENVFDVEIFDEEMTALETVGDVVRLVQLKKSQE